MLGPEIMVKLAIVPSTSVPASGTETAAPSSVGVAVVAGVAVGASLTAVTVMVALATGDVAPLLSVTVNGITTVPLKFAAGTNCMLAACAGVRAVLTGTATGGVAGLASLS